MGCIYFVIKWFLSYKKLVFFVPVEMATMKVNAVHHFSYLLTSCILLCLLVCIYCAPLCHIQCQICVKLSMVRPYNWLIDEVMIMSHLTWNRLFWRHNYQQISWLVFINHMSTVTMLELMLCDMKQSSAVNEVKHLFSLLDKLANWAIYFTLSLIHIWRCRRSYACRSRWSPYH